MYCGEPMHSAVQTGRTGVGVGVAGGPDRMEARGSQPGVRGCLGSEGKNSPHPRLLEAAIWTI